MTGITDDMIRRAAEEMRSQYDSEHDAGHLSWQDFTGDARKVLEAALAGRVVVDLPEPDERTVHAYLTFWNDHPETLPQEERFALQKLADIRAARRQAAEVSGGVGGDPQ